jgi:hypothetical protein
MAGRDPLLSQNGPHLRMEGEKQSTWGVGLTAGLMGTGAEREGGDSHLGPGPC